MLGFMLISFMASEFMFDLLLGRGWNKYWRGRTGMELKVDGDGWDGYKVCGDGCHFRSLVATVTNVSQVARSTRQLQWSFPLIHGKPLAFKLS